MKKIIITFLLIFSVSAVVGVDYSNAKAEEMTAEQVEASEDYQQTSAPISRWWYETTPMEYQGRTYFHRENVFGQCMEGYLGAVIVGAGYYQYEGYLYPCGGPKPIPTVKKPVDEVKHEE